MANYQNGIIAPDMLTDLVNAKRFKKLQECRQWIAEAIYIDEHSDLEQAGEMTVDAWLEYWIEIA